MPYIHLAKPHSLNGVQYGPGTTEVSDAIARQLIELNVAQRAVAPKPSARTQRRMAEREEKAAAAKSTTLLAQALQTTESAKSADPKPVAELTDDEIKAEHQSVSARYDELLFAADERGVVLEGEASTTTAGVEVTGMTDDDLKQSFESATRFLEEATRELLKRTGTAPSYEAWDEGGVFRVLLEDPSTGADGAGATGDADTGGQAEAQGTGTPLPDDFESRDLLVAAGLKTIEAVRGHDFETNPINGIGEVKRTRIKSALEELTG